MTDKIEFSTKNMIPEFCHFVDTDPLCMDNCFVCEPKGKRSVMVPVCPYVKKYEKTMKEGTLDSWEWDDCELRRALDPLERFLFAKESCPFFTEIFCDFADAYMEWLREEGEGK